MGALAFAFARRSPGSPGGIPTPAGDTRRGDFGSSIAGPGRSRGESVRTIGAGDKQAVAGPGLSHLARFSCLESTEFLSYTLEIPKDRLPPVRNDDVLSSFVIILAPPPLSGGTRDPSYVKRVNIRDDHREVNDDEENAAGPNAMAPFSGRPPDADLMYHARGSRSWKAGGWPAPDERTPGGLMNRLYYGDNLSVLRESIASETVDLVYLDPPFNSNASYNVLFKEKSGKAAESQIEAFEDTWHWGEEAERAFSEVLASENTRAAELLRAMRSALGDSDMMAYLAMMAVRLLQLHSVLKQTGSLYLHCDPTASHYLKILLDSIFGPTMFRNEIIWRRTGSHNSARRYGPIHDTILFYAKSKDYTWNRTYRPYLKGYVAGYFNKKDAKGTFRSQTLTGSGTRKGESGRPWRGYDVTAKGRHWAFPGSLADEFGIQDWSQHEKLEHLYNEGYIAAEVDGLPEYRQYLHLSKGSPLQDIWAYQPYTNGCLEGSNECIDEDVKWLDKRGGDERLGFPTQKPVALLERIISASSNEGDLVLDPFCGCGTTVHAAQKLGRQWIGIDVTHLAISLIERRLQDAFPGIEFEVHGTPKDLASALDLARRDKYQFQWWAVSMVGARPFGGKKKGADSGIDGILFFRTAKDKTEKAIVSVKGGDSVGVGAVRELIAVIEREKAAIGVLISAALPTRTMGKEAAAAGFFDSPVGAVPRIQLITLAELFQGIRPRIPLIDAAATFRTAAREKTGKQKRLL